MKRICRRLSRWGLLKAGYFAFACICPVVSATAAEPTPVTPTEGPIKLFNGSDLSGLYTYLKESGYEDPKGIFTVQQGQLHISGDGLGGIITQNAYRDYHLVFEFKWGERTWGNRVHATRDSGILVHCTGPDGAYGGIWPTSFEAQVIEGGCGDFIVVGGKGKDGNPVPISLSAETTVDRDGETVWHAGGEKKTISGGRINWFGRDPDWKDVLGFRGKDDVESPAGQWTRMDVICKGDRITNYVNGVKVNEAFNASVTAGKILIQTELAELWVRRWEMWPIDKGPKIEPAL